MVLYATDLVDLEKPKTVKTKRVSKKKVEEPVIEETVIEELKEIVSPPKLKRKCAPKNKVEQKPQEENVKEEVKEPLLIKDAPPKKTRKRKQIEVEEPVKEVQKIEQVCVSPTLAEEAEKPKKTRKKPKTEFKSTQTTAEPPVWFQKFVQSAEKEKAQSIGQVTKKQAKEIKTEALKTAHKSWQSGVTRDRVQGEVDSHSNLFLT